MANMVAILFKLRSDFNKLFFILILLVCISGCERMSSDEEKPVKPKLTLGVYKKQKDSKKQTVLWERIRKNFDMPRRKHAQEQARIQHFVQHYAADEKRLNRMSSQASPYLHFIVEELEKREMPGELALLPMIESAFEPRATSRKGAAGLWQFVPKTGKQYGLKQDSWYDARRDVIASTRAALDYLQELHKEFGGNWPLALAAYNAGPGTVHRAIKKNVQSGMPTTFWHLKLPKETQHYVPKFLALAEVVANPKKHDVSLPLIENKPYFVTVDPGKQVSLNKVAKIADISMYELKRLNAGYRKANTHPKGPKRLLLPVENAIKFEDNISKVDLSPVKETHTAKAKAPALKVKAPATRAKAAPAKKVSSAKRPAAKAKAPSAKSKPPAGKVKLPARAKAPVAKVKVPSAKIKAPSAKVKNKVTTKIPIISAENRYLNCHAVLRLESRSFPNRFGETPGFQPQHSMKT